MAESSATFLLFGATGDLARRMIFPSLYNLLSDGLLPDDFLIVASGRSELDDDAFRDDVDAALRQFLAADRYDSQVAATFRAMICYQPVEAGNATQFAALADRIDGRLERGLSVYLSTPPSLFAPTAQGLADAGLITPLTRIAMEKPIGKDLASSKQVNDGIGALFEEDQIFRVDHYLGKETVQNLLALRFANLLFEPVWNATYIDHVQITVAETIGLESRVAYYDDSGALRDMVQNHMLQLLALVAMEPPTSFDATAVRDEKVKVLRALRPARPEEVVTGQYRAGAVDGKAVPGYDEELGKESDTETYVALKAHVDNWRWRGVPFYLRHGKRMPERVTEIVIQFRCIPHSIFEGRGAKTEPNRLVIEIQPKENIQLTMMAKVPGLGSEGLRLRPVPLDIAMPDAFSDVVRRIAYERLLLDLIHGDQTLFVRRDEVEAQWDFIDHIRNLWAENDIQPKIYAAGTWGPSAAVALAERDGVTWHDD